MGVIITREDIIAYAEVDYIIHHMNEKYINKIPESLLNFFATIKDPNHKIYVDPKIPLQKQNLRKYTLEVLALLHLKYWCEDQERRKWLYQKMTENQKRLDEQVREKYSVEKIFDSNVDYSKPKSVTKYVNEEQNPDIQDYTDVPENKLTNYLKQDFDTEKKSQESNLVDKIKNIFKKK